MVKLSWVNGEEVEFSLVKYLEMEKEIVGGSKDGEIVCYDLVSNKVCARVNLAHSDEINSVCFANR